MKRFFKLLSIIGLFLCSSLIMTGCDDDLILVTGVDLYTNEIFIDVNESVDLSYKVYPSNATNKKVTFWSTDENIASVDENGKVTLKNNGEASIIIRSVDGGYEDYCKIATNIDPDAIGWDTSDKLSSVSGQTYSATGSMALNQIMKLKLNYFIDGEESDKVTNKKVKFTSSNTSNIQVINETEGIIKAVNNQILTGDKAYSDITATITTMEGSLTTTCRIYINEYSSLNHLYLNYKNGNTPVLSQRNGSETIYLTSGSGSVEYYTYITNMSDVVKTDYDLTVESSDSNLFTVTDFVNDEGIYGFKLTPSAQNEGTGALYIRSTCSDENGKTIRCSVNVTVQAKINSVVASATPRIDGGVEVLQNGEIFSIDLTYKKAGGDVIEGATRDIYFDNLEDIDVNLGNGQKSKLSNFIADYGNNQFKVKQVPADPTQKFKLTGYIYAENIEGSEMIPFTYEFYLRNSLDGIVVTNEPKAPADPIPNKGISSITLTCGGTAELYAYATTYDYSKTEPAIVTALVSDENLIGIMPGANTNLFGVIGLEEGVATITFVASDGIVEVRYDVTVYVVPSVATINLYGTQSNGVLSEVIDKDATEYQTSANELKLYVELQANDGYEIECPEGVKLTVDGATIRDIIENSKVIREITIDLSQLSSGQSKQITIVSERFLVSRTITIKKA